MATSNLPYLMNKGLTIAHDMVGQTHEPVGRKLFHYQKTASSYDMVQHTTGHATLPQPRGFGDGIVEASMTPGFAKTYIQVNYGLKDIIANELIERDEYGMLVKWVNSRGGDLAELYATNDELSAVSVFKAGFSTTTPAPGSPDGQPLFSASHPTSPTNSVTWSNMPPVTMPFGMAALQAARAALETQAKANGITKWDNKIDKVVFHPNIEEIVLQCLYGDWNPGSADLAMNTMKNRGIQPISWPYWEVSGSSNATAYNSWFVQGKTHYCRWFVLQPVKFKQQEILGINSTMFASFLTQVLGFDAAWGMFGSLAT